MVIYNNFDIFNSKGIIMEKIKIGNFISECRKEKKTNSRTISRKNGY